MSRRHYAGSLSVMGSAPAVATMVACQAVDAPLVSQEAERVEHRPRGLALKFLGLSERGDVFPIRSVVEGPLEMDRCHKGSLD